MKKLFFIALILISSNVFSQLDIFMLPHASTFGMGGAFTADPEGMTSFFYNPAGFASEEGEMTFASLNSYVFVDIKLIDIVLNILNGKDILQSLPKDIYSSVNEFMGLIGDSSKLLEWVQTIDSEDLQAITKVAVDTLGESVGNAFVNAYSGSSDGGLASFFSNSELIEGISDLLLNQNEEGDFKIVGMLKEMDKRVDADLGDYLPSDWADKLNSSIKYAKDSISIGSMQTGVFGGVAYAGDNLGLGVFAEVSGVFGGETLLASKGRLFTKITFAGGMSFSIEDILTLGVQLRPTIIGYVDIDPIKIIQNITTGRNFEQFFLQSIYTGFYVGVDTGVLIYLDPFTVGVTVKDLIPIPVYWTTLSGLDDLQNGLLGSNEVAEEDRKGLYQIPGWKVNAGLKFQPDLGPHAKWKVNFDIQDVFGFARYLTEEPIDIITLGTEYKIWEYFNIGTELSILDDILSIRAGYGDGFLSAGLGLDLFILDINVAAGLSNLKEKLDGTLEFQQLGVSIEAALRI